MRKIPVFLALLLLVVSAAVVLGAEPSASPTLSQAAFLHSLSASPAASTCAPQAKTPAGVAAAALLSGASAPLFDAGGGSGNPDSCTEKCCTNLACCQVCCVTNGRVFCTRACPC